VRELAVELDASDISWVDALPPMRAALERTDAGAGRLYYCADGHPTALGQQAYASAAAELLRRMGGLPRPPEVPARGAP